MPEYRKLDNKTWGELREVLDSKEEVGRSGHSWNLEFDFQSTPPKITAHRRGTKRTASQDIRWSVFRRTGFARYCLDDARALIALDALVAKKRENKSGAIEEIFG
jgi:hypothetical protein